MNSFGKRRSRRRSRRTRKSRRSRRSRRSRKGKIYRKPEGMSCKEFLSKKIAENMREFKSGRKLSNGRRITSAKQAIAIAYSQVRKGNPRCKL